MYDGPDTWQVEAVDGNALVSRPLGDGWRVEHRVVVEDGRPVIADTRVLPGDDATVPPGGLRSDVLRRITLGGVREAAERVLSVSPVGDLRHVEAVSPAVRRQGEARRWNLAVTALAYLRAVKAGSRKPSEEVARALGVDARTVRDRLYAARREEPPLLTGGGRKGVVGDPEFTAAGSAVLEARLSRLAASFGQAPGDAGAFTLRSTPLGFDRMTSELQRDAEARIPGLWEMGLDEIAARAREALPWWVEEVRRGKELRLTDRGFIVVERGAPLR
jgi:hypothetical protein